MSLKRFTQNAALAIGAIVLVVALAEAALRIAAPLEFSTEVEYVPDGHLGLRLTPGRRYPLRSGGTCSVNAQGFRGARDVAPGPAPGAVRIVALGGSSTFCYQTDDADTWCAILEQRLRAHYHRDLEVINAGVPGYSVFESKINYVYRIRPLEPDIVIVYHTWNDMKFFRSIEAGNYPLKGPMPEGWRTHLRSLARKFQIARRVRAFLNSVVYPRARENTYADPGKRATIAPDGPAHRWERQNFDDLAVLLAADSVVGVFSSQAGLLCDSTISRPEVRERVYTEYVGLSFDEMLSEWDAVGGIIADVAAKRSVCFVDTRHRVPCSFAYFEDHVHLTDKGNQAVADALFDGMTACVAADTRLRRGPEDGR